LCVIGGAERLGFCWSARERERNECEQWFEAIATNGISDLENGFCLGCWLFYGFFCAR
jgi:hypothetical protein